MDGSCYQIFSWSFGKGLPTEEPTFMSVVKENEHEIIYNSVRHWQFL